MPVETVWVELIFALIAILGVLGVFINRYNQEKGLGMRTIQFLTIVVGIPSIFILALEQIISPEATTALVGTIIGYIFSGFGARSP